jgi:hypothetical protein
MSLPHSKSNGDPSDGQNKCKTNPSTWEELESGPDRIGKQDQDLVRDRIWILGILVLIPVESRNRISKLLMKSVLSDYNCFTRHRSCWDRSLELLLLCFIEEFGA